MPRSFSLAAMARRLPAHGRSGRRDLRLTLRLALAVLLAANVVAAVLVLRPIGGSVTELERQAADLRRQATQRRATIERMRAVAAKVEKGRREGDQFLAKYFLARRSADRTLLEELYKSAQAAGVKPREHAFAVEPIEGSDTLSMLTITGNYEGSYADLVQFMNLLDRSPRLLIVESLQASPQQAGGTLSINMKLDAFTREAEAVK